MAHDLMPIYEMLSLKRLCILLESEMLGSGHLHFNNAYSILVFCTRQQHLPCMLPVCAFVLFVCFSIQRRGSLELFAPRCHCSGKQQLSY